MRGRPPKPTDLHHLQGTYRARHRRSREFEVIAEGDLTTTPSGLTPSQRLVWRYAIQHAPSSLLKKIDRDVLLVWVEARDRWNIAQQEQQRLNNSSDYKLLITNSAGVLMASPYNAIISQAAKIMLQACTQLGFSPAARTRLKSEQSMPSEDEAGPWAELRLVRNDAD